MVYLYFFDFSTISERSATQLRYRKAKKRCLGNLVSCVVLTETSADDIISDLIGSSSNKPTVP